MICSNTEVCNVRCQLCGNEHVIMANRKDLESWLSGEKYIQDALDYLSSNDRELLISGTCDSCWTKLYGEEYPDDI